MIAKFDVDLQKFSITRIVNSHYESKAMVSFNEKLFIITESKDVKEITVDGDMEITDGACPFEW
jgi:hypothetical protein